MYLLHRLVPAETRLPLASLQLAVVTLPSFALFFTLGFREAVTKFVSWIILPAELPSILYSSLLCAHTLTPSGSQRPPSVSNGFLADL